ncbi:MAG: hypothetical protein ACT4P2_12985 [Pseudomonadota bacterium]
MRAAEILFPAALFLLVGAFLGLGVLHYGYPWSVLGFPFAVGAFVCLLCVWRVARAGFGDGPREPAPEPVAAIPLASTVWVFAILPAVYALGFVFGPPAYVFLYLKLHGYGWRLSLALSAACLAAIYGVFIMALRIVMPLKPLWFD